MFRWVPQREGIFVRANSSVSARVCQAGATALSSEDNGMREPGEVSHGAVERSILLLPPILRYSFAVLSSADRTRFNTFSKMKFER